MVGASTPTNKLIRNLKWGRRNKLIRGIIATAGQEDLLPALRENATPTAANETS